MCEKAEREAIVLAMDALRSFAELANRVDRLEPSEGPSFESDEISGVIYGDLVRARHALACLAALTQEEGSEPVGWQHRFSKNEDGDWSDWQWSEWRLVAEYQRYAERMPKRYEVRPLYTPPPPLPVGSVDPRVARMAARCCVPEIDEPFFVLLGRDPQAPGLVEKWARDRKIAEPEAVDKWRSAAETGCDMRSWKMAHPDRGMSMEAFAKIGANADPRVREALDQAARVAEEWDSGWGEDRNTKVARQTAIEIAGAIRALSAPQSQGLVDAAEWHEEQQRIYEEKRLNPRSRETGMSGDYWTIAKAHQRSAEYFRSRASDRSA